ncbi:MAG TPA: hypothetical protein VMD92_03510 [Acidobacteriaceae bacterium]|nr:hypothetical protein [Acidobacteriaceae bacterium]
MIRSRLHRVLPLLAAGLLVLPLLNAQEGRGRKYKPPPPTCKISVIVVKSFDGKPVEDAAVIFHPINKDGKSEGNMELKTNEDGKAVINIIPIGDTVRIQVVATGYQTYGESYELPDDTKDITVRLHRPVSQYSIYQNHAGQSGAGQSGAGQSGAGQSGSQANNQQGSQQQQQSQGSQKPQ